MDKDSGISPGILVMPPLLRGFRGPFIKNITPSDVVPTHKQEGRRRVFCKPDPVIPPKGNGGHSSGPRVAAGLKQPTRSARSHRGETKGGPPLKRNLFGLAPGGGCQALPVARQAGGLLPRLFTLTPSQGRGGLFSVALSLGLPPVAVSDLPALWCPDFPPSAKAESGRLIPSGVLPVSGAPRLYKGKPALTSYVYNRLKDGSKSSRREKKRRC